MEYYVMHTFIILNWDCGWLSWSKFGWGACGSWELKLDGFIWLKNVIISNVNGTTNCLIRWLKLNCSDSCGATTCGQFKVTPYMDRSEIFRLHSIMRTNSTTQRLYGYFIIVIVHHRCNCFLLRVASASMSNSGIKGFSKYRKRYASYFINYAVQDIYSCVT